MRPAFGVMASFVVSLTSTSKTFVSEYSLPRK